MWLSVLAHRSLYSKQCVEFENTHLVIQTKIGCMQCPCYEATEYADIVTYVKLEGSA